jgi:excinuclease UvrABC ATPase subunit
MITIEQARIKPRQAGQLSDPSIRCEWCNGYGYVDDPMNVTIPCEPCDGTGIASDCDHEQPWDDGNDLFIG